jgi:hypothetical protein
MRRSLLLLFLFSFSVSRSQQLIFADQFGGSDTQSAQAIAADDEENLFVAITFYDELDADPGPGEWELEAEGSADVALVKLNSDGEFQWVIHLSSNLFEGAGKVVTDHEGSVFICGYFKGTIDFDPGPAEQNLTPVGNEDGYLAKYDADGNYLWAYRLGSSGYEEFYGMDVDSAGNIYSMGYFQNTIDFDPGAGVSNLTAIGGNANFFWKLDKDGNFIWAKQIPYTFAEDLALDADASIFVSGSFYGTVDFDPGSGTYNLTASGFGNDAYLLKLDGDGNFQWAGKMSGSSEESALCIGFDEGGKVLLGGRFQGTVDFDPGMGTANLTSVDYHDAFVECFNADGTFSWVMSYGGAGWQDASSISVDGSGHVHLAGQFEQTVDFDPSMNSFELTSNGYTDGYHLQLDDAGAFVSVFQVGGTLDDWFQQMVLDDEGGLLICGHFSWVTDFDPSASEYNLTSYTGWDGFAAKYCTAYTIEHFVSICEGDSIFVGGGWQTEAGDYFDDYDPAFGCDSTVITHLSVSETEVNLGNDTAICEHQELMLDAGNAGASYLWSTGETTQLIVAQEGGTYSVIVTDGNGCAGADTISILEYPLPQVTLDSVGGFCEGDSALLDAGNSDAAFLWSTGETTQMIYATETGAYWVTVTDANGCSNSDTTEVTVYPLPVVYFASGDTVVCLSSASVQLPEAFPWGGEYSGDGVSGNEFNPAIAGEGEHVITYSYTDSFGCTREASIIITVTVCTGAGEPQASWLCVFPNPAGGSLTIRQLHSDDDDLFLVDEWGQMIQQIQLNGESTVELDLSAFPAGIYFLTARQGRLVEKVVVNH